MIAARLRTARLLAGLTQDQTTRKLLDVGVSLTKGGLSKYERGGSVPPPSIILPLARVYGVKPAYFLRESNIEVEWFAFRRHASLGVRNQERIKARALETISSHVWLAEHMQLTVEHQFPQAVPVSTPEEAEDVAARLREKWELGLSPIKSVTQTIESKGGIVVDCDIVVKKFDGLAGLANGRYPAMVSATGVPDDRKRFNLAHEIGHLVMDCEECDDKTEEVLAHRFAGAFLVPEATAREELGARRRSLSYGELASLKTKHGLSMSAWLVRARNLSIISDSRYTKYMKHFSKRGWRRQEPVEYRGDERPTLLRQLTMRAVTEGIITPEKALELCPDIESSLNGETNDAPAVRVTALDVLRMSPVERRNLLAIAAEMLREDYETDEELTAFEALDEED